MDGRELLVVGCSHKTAPLELRETVAFAPAQVIEALRIVRGEKVLRETMILSTCNRTEFYSLSDEPDKAEAYVRELVARFKGNDLLGPGPYAYAYRDREMVRHLFRVAAGLDSMVLGEVQILGQVKEAYSLACEGGSAGVFLNRLLAAALRAGKRARAETEIGAGAVSFASAAVAVSSKIFSDLGEKRVLLIGAGETGRLAGRHFAAEGPGGLLIANRTRERAQAVAEELGGEIVPFSDLGAALVRADVVVCATRSPGILIDEEMVRRAMRERSGQPIVFVDMAIPRDVAPAVARLDSVFLYSLDSLQTIVEQNLIRRRREVPRVQAIVDQEVERFFQWTRSFELIPIVRALRARFESVRAEEVKSQLHHFTREDGARLDMITKTLINKLLHQPTTRIKALDPESEDGLIRLDAVRELFDLPAIGDNEDEPFDDASAQGRGKPPTDEQS